MNSKLSTISLAKLSSYVPIKDMQWAGFTSTSYAAAELWAFHYARTAVADLRDYRAVDFDSELDAIEHIDSSGNISIVFRRAYLWRIHQAASSVDCLDAHHVFERLHGVLASLSGLDVLRYERVDDYVYARAKKSRWEEICDQIYLVTERIDFVMSRESASIHETDKPTLSSRTYYPVWLLAFLFDLVGAKARKKLR